MYLTATQERLLSRLLHDHDRLVSWAALAAVIDGEGWNPPQPQQVYWHIHHLRKRIGAKHLLTVRGRGVLLR